MDDFNTYVKTGKTRLGVLGKNPHEDWWILLGISLILLIVVCVIAFLQMKYFESLNNASVEENSQIENFNSKEIENIILEFENKRGL